MLEFGTDGVRGTANVELSPELVLSLGRAAARVLGADRWFVGRDTRVSGPLLQAALMVGMASEGARVVDLGVVPTPAVAFHSEHGHAPGAVVSASHNPFADNGVKLFAAGGRKLDDAAEARLESELAALGAADRPVGDAIGRLEVDTDPTGPYVGHVLDALEGRRLGGMRVVLDCANGAASALAGPVLARAGADVEVINASPDGTNINQSGGSTSPQGLQDAVVRLGADSGLAFDGDADRVLAVDHTGTLVDGDHILAICAVDLSARGLLTARTVVVTVMTNLGFRRAMAEQGITVVETGVGDRLVLEALEAGGFSLGGEQSGHIIFRDVATTGDGVLTGVRLLDVVCRSGRTLHDLAGAAMTRLPQVLRNVAVANRDGLDAAHPLWDEVAAVEAELGTHGRVLVRPSGTEPLVRIMVEAPSQLEAEAAAERLSRAVSAALGPAG